MSTVSVIVPVYNSEKYLRECLESLAAQTLDDIEVIIVNDGSTDGSRTVAEKFASADDRFTVYSTENMGVSHARNYGVKMAHGDYIAFVDSDDTAEPDYCRAMYEKAVRDGNDLVVCRYDRITMSGRQLKSIEEPGTLFKADNFTVADRRELFQAISVGPWDKLIRRELMDKLAFPEGIRYAEDRAFSVKAFCYARNIGTINKVLYHYYFEARDGVTTRFGEERLDWIKVMENITDFMRCDESGMTMKDELEFFMHSKSMRLCASAIVRTELQYGLRVGIIRNINEFLNRNFPDRYGNRYYIADLEDRSRRYDLRDNTYRNGKRIRPFYCNYGTGHSIFLIRMSRVLPETLFNALINADQMLFFAFRRVRQGVSDILRQGD